MYIPKDDDYWKIPRSTLWIATRHPADGNIGVWHEACTHLRGHKVKLLPEFQKYLRTNGYDGDDIYDRSLMNYALHELVQAVFEGRIELFSDDLTQSAITQADLESASTARQYLLWSRDVLKAKDLCARWPNLRPEEQTARTFLAVFQPKTHLIKPYHGAWRAAIAHAAEVHGTEYEAMKQRIGKFVTDEIDYLTQKYLTKKVG